MDTSLPPLSCCLLLRIHRIAVLLQLKLSTRQSFLCSLSSKCRRKWHKTQTAKHGVDIAERGVESKFLGVSSHWSRSSLRDHIPDLRGGTTGVTRSVRCSPTYHQVFFVDRVCDTGQGMMVVGRRNWKVVLRVKCPVAFCCWIVISLFSHVSREMVIEFPYSVIYTAVNHTVEPT